MIQLHIQYCIYIYIHLHTFKTSKCEKVRPLENCPRNPKILLAGSGPKTIEHICGRKLSEKNREVFLAAKSRKTPRNFACARNIRETPRNFACARNIRETPRNFVCARNIRETPRNFACARNIQETPRIFAKRAVRETPRNSEKLCGSCSRKRQPRAREVS